MDERFIEIIGEDIIRIAEEWKQLSAKDLIEIKAKGIKRVWCVYNGWMDLATTYLKHDMCDENIPQYLIACVDIKVLAKYLEKENSHYTVLESGMIIEGEG